MLDIDITKKLGEFKLRAKFSITDEKTAILGASGCGVHDTEVCIAGIETPE